MHARHAIHDRQAQPRSADAAARLFQARKRPLHALGFGFRDAGPTIEHLDHGVAGFNPGLDFDRPVRITQCVVYQVRDRAAHRHLRKGHADRRGLAVDQRAAQLAVAFADLPDQHLEVGLGLRLVLAFRKIEKLADDLVHFVDVDRKRFTLGGIAADHLQSQAKPRERRAQIVRNARKHHRAVALEPRQVRGHLVERSGKHADLGRALLGRGVGAFSPSDLLRGTGQRRQRPADARGDHPGADEREQQGEQAPADPLGGEIGLEAVALEHDPEFVVVDVEAHPVAFDAVARKCQARARSEARLDAAPYKLEQRLRRHGLELLFGGPGVDADPFGLVEVEEEVAAQAWIGVHDRGAREVYDGDGLLRDLARDRLALVRTVDLEPAAQGKQEEQGNQQERAREEGIRPPESCFPVIAVRGRRRGHFKLPSGTNT